MFVKSFEDENESKEKGGSDVVFAELNDRMEKLFARRFGLFEIVGRRSEIDLRYSEWDISSRQSKIKQTKKENEPLNEDFAKGENPLFSFLFSFLFLLFIGRKQPFDLNVPRCRGFVLLEWEIGAGGQESLSICHPDRSIVRVCCMRRICCS